ncbi:MAG: hypothetical protein E6J75_02515, partial [Deltaproteobacteria bacterium]
MKQTLALLLKFAVTLGIFAAIFIEYRGGYAPVRTADLAVPGTFVPIRLAEAPPDVYFRLQGFQLVPAEPRELWAEIRSLRLGVFLPWFLAAMAIKLAGIFANVLRWQVLLRGQGIELGFGFLARSYFIGRYFGIVTPST